MLKVIEEKYKKSALEDIAELHASLPVVKDSLTGTMYFMKWHTRKYIMEKFDLTEGEVREYLQND